MKLIPLSKEGKKNNGKFAKVDDEDYDWLMKFDWHASKSRQTFYACRWIESVDEFGNKKRLSIRMHKMLKPVGRGLVVDHENRDGLDNQKHNLRTATKQQNGFNRSPAKNKSSAFIGVSFCKIHNRFRSRICINGKTKYLGYFKNEVEAVAARDAAAKKFHGEFACININQ